MGRLENDLETFIKQAHQKSGYAVGDKKIGGPIPGTVTFAPFEKSFPSGFFTFRDVYFPEDIGGGFSTVSLEGTTRLFISYGGGLFTQVPKAKKRSVMAALKRGIKNSRSRIPGERIVEVKTPTCVYLGRAMGNIWNLRWLELIVKVGKGEEIAREVLRSFDQVYANHADLDNPNILFVHRLSHQRIG